MWELPRLVENQPQEDQLVGHDQHYHHQDHPSYAIGIMACI